MPQKTIRRVDISSAAIVFAAFGLVSGLFIGFWAVSSSPYRGFDYYLIIVFLSTVVGTFSGGVQAFVYNVVARYVGGLRIDLHGPTREPNLQSANGLQNEALIRCPNCHSLEDRDRDNCRFCGDAL